MSTHLNDIESNYKMPSLIFAIKIAKALKVNINDLYYIERY
ncbi:MAG TPA: helix-turn-helix transcriptional regulator [Candidatus Scatovivens faecipullorum]|nr:helix-turn-helix transcriptional regulator [Candidatus Scatovivens faecipullorum]